METTVLKKLHTVQTTVQKTTAKHCNHACTETQYTYDIAKCEQNTEKLN